MLKDTNKFSNDDDDCCTDQQLIGNKDMTRGVIVKDWSMENCNSENFIRMIKF